MALSLEQEERLRDLLINLEPEAKAMKDHERGFVEDQIKRFEQYGSRVFISPKQWGWLDALHEKYCGVRLEEGGQEDVPDDLDDEIPF